MRDVLKRSILALVCSCGFAAAQVTAVAGTGCVGYGPTPVSGPLTLGSSITISQSQSCTAGPNQYIGIILLGWAQTPTILYPQCLATMPCVIGVLPIHSWIQPGFASWTFQLPTDPAFSGFCFFAQSSCVFWPPPCAIRMHQAVQICIQ